MVRQGSGETEYQGQFLAWLKADLNVHNYVFEDATQEFPNSAGKRSDVIVWMSRAARQGFLEIELKTPTTPLSDLTLQEDAVRKARRVGAPYICLSNMRDTAIYKTPSAPRTSLLDDDLIKQFDPIESVRGVADWVDADVSSRLKARSHEILLAAHDLHTSGTLDTMIVDATVFVDALKDPMSRLSAVLRPDVRAALTNRTTNRTLKNWADEQGLSFFVSDLGAALAGQLSYRIAGQILFYYAFRRHQAALPPIRVDSSSPVIGQLRVYWDSVRAFDYEALFEPSPLESIPFSSPSEEVVRELVEKLAAYDWNRIDVDVLGSIFEQLIPASERILLGQYYTPFPLVDLVLSFTLEEEPERILDPAVGSGTFLQRAYNRLRRKHQWSHEQALEALWGTDISAFPAELAVINICRQDLSSHTNYPRIMVKDFFKLQPAQTVRVPVAKPLPGGSPLIEVPLPSFTALVGNPPFVRSQQLDDLDPGYKAVLQRLALREHVDDAKFDAFAYFVLHAADFLQPTGRLGFVTSASWLTTDFGSKLQRFLLSRFKVLAVIFSQAEPFFPFQDVNTVAVICERREDNQGPKDADESVRFITLTKSLADLMGDADRSNYWQDVDLWVDDMLAAPIGNHDGFRIASRNAQEEFQSLVSEPRAVRNWAKPLKESEIYREIFDQRVSRG